MLTEPASKDVTVCCTVSGDIINCILKYGPMAQEVTKVCMWAKSPTVDLTSYVGSYDIARTRVTNIVQEQKADVLLGIRVP